MTIVQMVVVKSRISVIVNIEKVRRIVEVADWPTVECQVCGKPVIQAVDGHGKPVFVDPVPNSAGSTKLVDRGTGGLPLAVIPVVAKRFGMVMRMNHTNTCDKWRGKKLI